MNTGDRVKLSERGLRAFTKRGGAPKRRTIDWKSREGSVWAITRGNEVRVIWDGCKAPDFALPMTVFEVIPSAGDAV